ncbi:hypothetical protein [Halorubrum tebenquichense]|uniref:Uncharacterized protein n=1 Tax=Halorubrum tebenquichense DSM 14210 TaxID=1227485 RepID=M0DQY1_9EURY|nr:hypothetical protein [Halorubrum tebenquichense]ELZ37253.1 hypothetical protein C472_09046 [Halorubrum tebenquichense DSM 14210]
MSPGLPSARTAAIVSLLLVGVALSFAFHATAAGSEITYEATPVEPGEDPDPVAEASSNVTDLDERLSDTADRNREPVRTAAATGSFEGALSSELAIALDGAESRYARYDGRYYEWSLSTGDETANATIEMRPTDAESVFAAVARPASESSADVRRIIDEGTANGSGVRSGLFRRDGAYYAVAIESEAAVAGQIASSFAGFALTPVGRGYAAVGLGLLAYRYREPTRDRLLTVRRAAAVAALAVPLALVATALFETGSPARFVIGPATATVVASGVVAGACVASSRWRSLVGVTVGIGLFATAAIAAPLGPIGFLFGPLAVLFGIATGAVPFGYGYWFARPAADATSPSDSAAREDRDAGP